MTLFIACLILYFFHASPIWYVLAVLLWLASQ